MKTPVRRCHDEKLRDSRATHAHDPATHCPPLLTEHLPTRAIIITLIPHPLCLGPTSLTPHAPTSRESSRFLHPVALLSEVALSLSLSCLLVVPASSLIVCPRQSAGLSLHAFRHLYHLQRHVPRRCPGLSASLSAPLRQVLSVRWRLSDPPPRRRRSAGSTSTLATACTRSSGSATAPCWRADAGCTSTRRCTDARPARSSPAGLELRAARQPAAAVVRDRAGLAHAVAAPPAAPGAAPGPPPGSPPAPLQPQPGAQAALNQPPQPGQAPPAPAHLAAFPPPMGGANPAQLLSQAQAAAVSAPNAHPPYSFAIGLGQIGIGSVSAAGSAARDNAQYPRDPALANSPAAWMPLALAPVRPERSDKKPRTIDELSALLDVWLQSDPSLHADTARLHAFHGYAKDVIAIAHDYGVPWALGYHAEALRAWTHVPEPLYCPTKHGPRCEIAFLKHAQRTSRVPARDSPRAAPGHEPAPTHMQPHWQHQSGVSANQPRRSPLMTCAPVTRSAATPTRSAGSSTPSWRRRPRRRPVQPPRLSAPRRRRTATATDCRTRHLVLGRR